MLLDKDIREPLFDFLEEQYGKTRILEEKQIGKSRADVVMITPEALYGIEIKSDADTYTRLSRQIKDYNNYYDYNYVVVGSSHAMHIEEHVPEWWGIITVDEVEVKPDFYMVRKPLENPKVELKKQLSLLWRPELVHMQELNEMPKYKAESKLFVIEKILLKIPEDRIKLQLCEELFQRDYDTIAEIINQYRMENGQKPRRRKKRRKRKTIC
ncbi:MAG: sce7726 family protein [Lachnospiraceae bacterium]|nr:sce7726 family protein [Lachnospiraceae bacterium]